MTPSKKLNCTLIFLSIVFYAMEGVLINPFIVWVLSPLFVAAIWSSRSKTGNLSKPLLGFVLGSVLILLLVHVLWAFNISGAKTGSSTSALIFAVAPVYAFIVGGFFGLVGHLIQRGAKNA